MYSEQALRHELERHRMQGRETEVRRIKKMLDELYGGKKQAAVRKPRRTTSAPSLNEDATQAPDETREA